MTRTVVIAQARLGSTRLPGKVLEKLGDKTVLEHCLERALVVPGIDAVCLATTDLPSDDKIAELASRLPNIQVVRGHATDVLARYHTAALATEADVILRITCDCPLIDPMICSDVLALRTSTNATFASNNSSRDWPHGLDCEVFTRDALDNAMRCSTTDYDREHVGPWMRRYAEPAAVHLSGPGGAASRHRWTLDYPEDLEFFRTLWPFLPTQHLPSWKEVAAIIEGHWEVAAINAMHVERH